MHLIGSWDEEEILYLGDFRIAKKMKTLKVPVFVEGESHIGQALVSIVR